MPDGVLRLIYTEHGLSASNSQGPDLAVCDILACFFFVRTRYLIARENP